MKNKYKVIARDGHTVIVKNNRETVATFMTNDARKNKDDAVSICFKLNNQS